MSASTDSIGLFVQTVAGQLAGPRKHRAAIVAELKDGLLEAAESYERAGYDQEDAVRLALDEFGDAGALAGSFRPELMIARGRQTALALFGTTFLVIALWLAAARSRHTTPTNGLFDSPIDHFAVAALIGVLIACGLSTVAPTGRLSRRFAIPPQMSLIGAAAMGLVAILADLAAVTVLGVRLAAFPGTIHAIVLATAITASCTSILLATRASSACIAMIKAPADRAAAGISRA